MSHCPTKPLALPLLKHLKDLVQRDIEEAWDDKTKGKAKRDERNESLLVWIKHEITKRHA